MVARALIAKRAVDQDIVWSFANWRDLPGRSDADQEAATTREHLLSQQHGKRGPDRAANHAELQPIPLKLPHLGVVASPMVDWLRLTGALEIANHISVRVEKAKCRHISMIEATLPPRLAKQVGGLKHRGRLRVLEGENRRFRLDHRSDPLKTAELKTLNLSGGRDV